MAKGVPEDVLNVLPGGVIPDSFRRLREQQPDAELQLQPAASLAQGEATRSGLLDAGFLHFMPKADAEWTNFPWLRSISSWPCQKDILSRN
jgi:hypothetical protein